MGHIVAVDSGGTFTDTVVLSPDGHITVAKAPSTPENFALGVLESVRLAAERLGLPLQELLGDALVFAHGTTVGTNALLTRQGAKTGLITTRGHEDAIIIGRTIQKVAGRSESEITQLAQLDKADPIVPRPLIKGIRERVDYKGEVIVPLNEEDVLGTAQELAAAGCESVAVTLLWSFLHPQHEQRVKAIISENFPQLQVSLSSELAPVIKEYERAATTAINAYIGRATGSYLSRLSRSLKEAGLRPEAVVMLSSGGVAPIREAQERAVALLSSGPAGGVMGAVALGKALGHKNMITTDVGGTSFDVGLVVDLEPQFSLTPIFAQYHTVLPSIDIISIGAGGGSIAWLEESTNLLKVGPQSAGAQPGPVCYGEGGEEPTVTDANVVLNRLNPDFFLGGERRLDREAAREAIDRKIARPLGMSVEGAAFGILKILDAKMADLVRKVTIGRGFDPREFILLGFGGAGPLHVGAYARDVGVQKVIVPAYASEFSAWGIADSEFVYLRQSSAPMIAPFPADRINAIYAGLEEEVGKGLESCGVRKQDMTLLRSIDLRYRGQIHEVRVPVPHKALGVDDLARVETNFEEIYNRKYGEGAAFRQAGIESRTYQVRGLGRIPKPTLSGKELVARDPSQALKATRPVYFEEGFVETPVYDKSQLLAGHKLQGAALVEAVDTTIVLHPGQSLRVDEYGNFVMAVQ